MLRFWKAFAYSFGCLGALLVWLLIIALLVGISWSIIVSLVYVIAWCFGLTMTLPIATGIWLIICILTAIFSYKED